MNDSRTLPKLAALTALEKAVIDGARRGDFAQPATEVGVADLAVTDDPALRVRAELIRELLRGLHGDLDPRGIRVRGVRVVGQLDLDHVTAVTGLALVECALPDGITCMDARLRDLYLPSSSLTTLHADGLRTVNSLMLRDATLTGTGGEGVIRLLGAHIGGQLVLDHAAVSNTDGPALNADNLRTDDNLSLRGATLIGAGADGAVRMTGAHIGGYLVLDRTEITNTLGPALYADNLRTDSDLSLMGADLTGAGETGAVGLIGAHISGLANLRVKQLSNSSGPLLELSDAHITEVLCLPASVVCPASGTGVGRRGCSDSGRTIDADGLVFASLSRVSWRQWLHLLVHHTASYRPQPFQQLAKIERASGHDNNARHILITQQDELRRRDPDAFGGRLGHARHWLWGWLGRYGYRAHRLVVALGVVLALAAGLGYVAGHIGTYPGHYAAERVGAAVERGTSCSAVELIGLGVDRGLPLGATGVRAHCDLDTTTAWGQRITVAIWVLQALVWALATLAVAAYTGLVRKPA